MYEYATTHLEPPQDGEWSNFRWEATRWTKDERENRWNRRNDRHPLSSGGVRVRQLVDSDPMKVENPLGLTGQVSSGEESRDREDKIRGPNA